MNNNMITMRYEGHTFMHLLLCNCFAKISRYIKKYFKITELSLIKKKKT